MKVCKWNGKIGIEGNNVTADANPYFSVNELANRIQNTTQALQKHGTGNGRLDMPCIKNIMKPMYWKNSTRL
jgi:hypothetical protein